ncbi:MAG: hypothetical protein J2P18_15650 [Nocardia sp.]|nr:hypothetical protein [Nocardia sp.]
MRLRTRELSPTARYELLAHGLPGMAIVLGMRPCRDASDPAPDRSGGPELAPAYLFWVRVQPDDHPAYETRIRQRAGEDDIDRMQPGDVVGCRVDPGDPDRVALYVPDPGEAPRVGITKILTSGRRAEATVLAAVPIAADYSGRDDPVLRLDLEIRAWDESEPWRVRIVQPVPLHAIDMVDLGRTLKIAFFTVDRGESVAVDWEATTGR